MTTDATNTMTGTALSFQSDEPHRITIEPVESDTWFQVLHWFYDRVVSGEPGLSGKPLAIMLGMFRYRDRRTGLVAKSRADFRRELGMSKGHTHDSFNALLTDRRGLLAEHGPSLYEPLPGRTWAGRKIEPEVRKTDPPVRKIGLWSGISDCAQATDRGAIGNACAGARALRELESKADIDDERAAVLILTRAGEGPADRRFTEDDARGTIRRTGATAETCRTAVRNADAKARVEKLDNWRAYVYRQLRDGCSLFAGLARQDEQIGRNAEVVARLLSEHAAQDFENAALVQGWWNTLGERERINALTAAERRREPAWQWSVLVRKAADAVARRDAMQDGRLVRIGGVR